MGRILAIDYGSKRSGLAVTDPFQIIATPLETVASSTLIDYLKSYLAREQVESIVIGMPKTLRNEDSQLAPLVRTFVSMLKKTFPAIPVYEADERFTSSIAQQAMLMGGVKKKKRQEKGAADPISATLILQGFLEGRKK